MAEGFDKNLDIFTETIKNVPKKKIEEIQNRAFKRLRELTPVATGRARDGWFKETRGEDRAIVNEVPYIKVLEDGSSKQAPRGMVAVFVAEESRK